MIRFMSDLQIVVLELGNQTAASIGANLSSALPIPGVRCKAKSGLSVASGRLVERDFRIAPDYELTGSYSESEGSLWKVATSQSACLCSRVTGHLTY